MNSITRWTVFILLVFLSVLMTSKGIELWSLGNQVDGGGIGIHFLGWEVNDRVPETSLPSYAVGFFVASFCTILASIIFLLKTRGRAKSINI